MVERYCIIKFFDDFEVCFELCDCLLWMMFGLWVIVLVECVLVAVWCGEFVFSCE